MANDTRYSGWTNYETWTVKLWMDNEEGSYNYWRDVAVECWNESADKHPNQFCGRRSNAKIMLADRLQNEHSDHPAIEAANGTVYADLLNAALSEVNWAEIADSLLDDAKEKGLLEHKCSTCGDVLIKRGDLNYCDTCDCEVSGSDA